MYTIFTLQLLFAPAAGDSIKPARLIQACNRLSGVLGGSLPKTEVPSINVEWL